MVDIAERVRRFALRLNRSIRCTTCQLPHGIGRRLISGPGVYICESCIALASSEENAAEPATRCSFCGRRDVRIARTWSELAICLSCVERARSILAEDVRRSRHRGSSDVD
jgi:hypothetical protein